MNTKDESMANTFCPIPWIFQAVRNNGDIRVCCQANVTDNQGVVRKEDGTPYNKGAFYQSLKDVTVVIQVINL